MSEDDLEASYELPSLPPGAVVVPRSAAVPASVLDNPDVPARIDKINHLQQKEIALAKAGVSRYKYMLVIAEALEAVHWVDEYDKQGNCIRVERPHVARRQWGAEQAAKLYGDMIERKEIEHDLGDKTLERFRVLSVDELKKKALEIASSLNNRVIDV